MGLDVLRSPGLLRLTPFRLLSRLCAGLLVVAVALILVALQAGRTLPYMGELAYIATQNGFSDAYVYDVQREFSLRLERPFVNDCCLSWSPDGRLLTLVVDMSSDGSTDIFTMNFHTPAQRLTFEHGADLYPVYSPDGRQIAYTHVGYGDPQLFLMNTDGSGGRLLTGQHGVVNLNPRPVWSLDGQRILFSDFGSTDTLLGVPVDCTDPCDTAIHPNFSTNGIDLMTTTFAPLDARRLWLSGFNRAPEGGYGVYVLDSLSSTMPERLTINPNLASPSVAVHGYWVAFVSGERDTRQPNEDSYLYLLDTRCIGQAGGCAGQLQRVAADLNIDDNLSWSPDGRWLAFVTVEGGQVQLNLLDMTCVHERRDCDEFIRKPAIRSLRYIRPAWRPFLISAHN